MGITGPDSGFSCWAFDYDNDGWLDIFATCYDRTLDDVVRGMQGQPPAQGMDVTRLYRNLGGKKFQDVSKETGVDKVFATMGSNFARLRQRRLSRFLSRHRRPDLRHAGSQPHVQERRPASASPRSPPRPAPGICRRDTASPAATGTATATSICSSRSAAPMPGDRYHNVLFQNPGQGNNWLTVKLVGKKTNRAAIGARIKVVTAGEQAADGASPRQQRQQLRRQPAAATIGLGKANSVANAGSLLADQPNHAGLSRRGREPGHRGDGVRQGLSQTELDARAHAKGMTEVAGRGLDSGVRRNGSGFWIIDPSILPTSARSAGKISVFL